MPTKIRLARHGRKRNPFYHIVIADSRAPRDGKFIERVGSYNPNTNPATIDLDFDRTLDWFQKGAQPTDTVKAILSHTGILHKNHLLIGVKKGAFTEEVAEERFKDWVESKQSKIEERKSKLSEEKTKAEKKKLAAEAKVNEDRAKALAAKQSELVAQLKAAQIAEASEEVSDQAEVAAEPSEESPAE